MRMLRTDSICTQGERERQFKTAGRSDSGWAEFPSANAGLSPVSAQEVEDELALKKILHLHAGKYTGPFWTLTLKAAPCENGAVTQG